MKRATSSGGIVFAGDWATFMAVSIVVLDCGPARKGGRNVLRHSGAGAQARLWPRRGRAGEAVVDRFAQAVARQRHDRDARNPRAVELAQMRKQVGGRL